MTEETQIKIDKIYEKEIGFEDIKDNPILQPISEIKSNYESHSLMIAKATIEFTETKKRIDEMIEKNPVYSECIIIGEFKDLIRNMKDVIHSQDIQREFLKQAINKMLNNSQKYYETKVQEGFPIESSTLPIAGKRGRPRKKETQEIIQEIEDERK